MSAGTPYDPELRRVHERWDEWAERMQALLEREEPNEPWFDREWDEVELGR